MTRKEFYSCLSVLTVMIILSGCLAATQSYQPKSPDEIQIKELISKLEITWNNHDIPGFLALWNDKAKIMYGKDRQIASKKEYANILPERMNASPSLTFRIKDIKVSGNKAEASVFFDTQTTTFSATKYLIKENGLWSIMSWEYWRI